MSGRIDISDFLLGELSGQDRVEAERLMREDPEFRAAVERMRPTVRALESVPDEAWSDLEPPPLELPSPGPETTPAGTVRRPAPPESPWRRLLLRPMPLALASLALLAAGLGIGLLVGGDEVSEPDSPAEVLALEPVEPRGEGAGGSVELIRSGGGEEAVVEVSGIEPNAPGEFYELWLLTAPDELVSLGSFQVRDPSGTRVSVPLPVDPSEFEFIDLSLERADGDPSHSGRSILRAPT